MTGLPNAAMRRGEAGEGWRGRTASLAKSWAVMHGAEKNHIWGL